MSAAVDIDHELGAAGDLTQGVDDERGREDRRERTAPLLRQECLPADDADPVTLTQAGLAQPLLYRRATGSIDPHQAQRWAEDDVDLDRDDRDVADVLLADEQRSPTSSEHEQYLLEARVEVAQEDEARRVLAVAVDDDLIDVDRREQGFDSLLELGGGDDRQRLRDVERGHPYVSQVDRSRHGCSFDRVAILTPDSPRRTVGRQVRW